MYPLSGIDKKFLGWVGGIVFGGEVCDEMTFDASRFFFGGSIDVG